MSGRYQFKRGSRLTGRLLRSSEFIFSTTRQMSDTTKARKRTPALALSLLVCLITSWQVTPARAFETPRLNQAMASYSIEAIEQVKTQLGRQATPFQTGELLSAKAMVLFADGDNVRAKQTALAAIASLNRSIARGHSIISAHFLLFKIDGQLSVLDWTYALQTQGHLNYLRIHAPGDSRTRMAEAMHALYAPSLLGGNPTWALKTMKQLLDEKYDAETAAMLAVAYEQTGRSTKAKKLAQNLLRRNPADRVARGIIWRLQNQPSFKRAP